MAGLMQGRLLDATAWSRPHCCSCQRPLIQRSSAWRPHRRGRHRSKVTAAGGDEVEEPPSETEPTPQKRKKGSKKRAKPDQELKLSSFNPLTLGRQSRQIFDDVWLQFTKLSSPTRGGTDRLAQTDIGKLSAAISPEFEAPQAGNTQVLVVGATGRVGRILVRKLLLRGYKVRAFVRQGEEAGDEQQAQRPAGLPDAVDIVYGDVGDYVSCKAAMEDIDKVVYTARATNVIQVELKRVEEQGVANMAKALADVRNERFRKSRKAAKLLTQKLVPPKELKAMHGEAVRAAEEGSEGPAPLQLMDLGDSSRKVKARMATITDTAAALQSQAGGLNTASLTPADMAQPSEPTNGKAAAASKEDILQQLMVQLDAVKQLSQNFKAEVADFGKEEYRTAWRLGQVGLPDDDPYKKVYDINPDRAKAKVNKSGNLLFHGSIYSRGGYAECGTLLTEETQAALAACEGLVLKVRGDAHNYTCFLTTASGKSYSARFPTQQGYQSIRLPFTVFRPMDPFDEGFDVKASPIVQMTLRYEPRALRLPKVILPGDEDKAEPRSDKDFSLAIDWIRAFPSAPEADFILVSCARGTQSIPGYEGQLQAERVLAAKLRGETLLKRSGLGYTVVRPGTLLEEPGGYKALVFDQGNRITEAISCADVADVCLKALHDPAAHNKTFEVCYEYTPQAGLDMYELVAHLPDKSNNYLGPALQTLQKNT